jgi:hypothetical protein
LTSDESVVTNTWFPTTSACENPLSPDVSVVLIASTQPTHAVEVSLMVEAVELSFAATRYCVVVDHDIAVGSA